jgi:RHS repeat-associated protein
VAPASWTGFTIYTVEKRSYDNFGHLAASAISSATTTYSVAQHNYDSYGHPNCTAVRMNANAFPAIPANEFQALPTDACALGTQSTQFGPDRITKTSYNILGDLLSVQKAYGVAGQQVTEVSYTYTTDHKIDTITDANGYMAKYHYDGLDRQDRWYFPSPTQIGVYNANDFEAYDYDGSGNRKLLQKRDGRFIRFTYDALNRVVSKCVTSTASCVAPNATTGRDVYYGYDLLGRRLSAKFDSATGQDGIVNSYDAFGNLLSSTITMGTFAKTVGSQNDQYDNDGNRLQLTHPDAQVFTYRFDGFDRLNGIYEGAGTGTPLDRFAYNPDQTVLSRTEGAGTGDSSTSYAWDGAGRLTGQSDAFASATTSNVGWTFTPNPAGQIWNEARDNDAYAFPTAEVGSVNRTYVTNGLNQYSSAGSDSFQYDVNGNLKSDTNATATATYTYDAENRLVKAVTGPTTVNLTYDALGRLFSVDQGTNATTTKFVYDGDALVDEFNYNGATLKARYVHGSNSAADDPYVWYQNGATRRYLHADHIGSIVAITSSTAPSINSYDEYGIADSGNLNAERFQYTGQAFIPELGMYYYKARMYSATLGRFMQVDPVGYTGGVNLYGYVNDDPLNASDPTGTTCTRTAVSQAFNCKIDQVVANVKGKLIVRDATAADHKKYAAVERSLTRAANAAAKFAGSRTITVNAGKQVYSFAVTGKQIAQQLAGRIVKVNPYADGAMDSPKGMIEVNRWGIDPSQGTGRDTLIGDSDTTRAVEFIHEGIHWTPGEANGFGPAQVHLGQEPLFSAHQDPYTDAAQDILGPN